MSLSQHDQEWAANFARSMNEKYGRHNSSHFRPNIVRSAESIFGRDTLEGAARPMVGDDGLRVIGRIECVIKNQPQDCQIGDLCRLESIKCDLPFVRVCVYQPPTVAAYCEPQPDDLAPVLTMHFEKVRIVGMDGQGWQNSIFWKRIE